MKKVLSFMVAVLCCVSVIKAQVYNQVKVTLSNGFVVKGTNATISKESITFSTDNQIKTYPLSEVNLVQARSGSTGKWALGCGGGCLAVCAIAGVAAGTDGISAAGGNTGTYILGSLLWTGIFAGVGALIGSMSDHEQTVYLKSSSMLNNLKLNFSTERLTKESPTINNITIAYRF